MLRSRSTTSAIRLAGALLLASICVPALAAAVPTVTKVSPTAATIGDVVTVNLARDYQATSAVEEDIQDGDRQTRRSHRLSLSASTPDAT